MQTFAAICSEVCFADQADLGFPHFAAHRMNWKDANLQKSGQNRNECIGEIYSAPQCMVFAIQSSIIIVSSGSH